MSAAAPTLPRLRAPRRLPSLTASRRARLAELLAFTALAVLIARPWGGLVAGASVPRIVLAVLLAIAGAAGAQAMVGSRRPARTRRLLGLILPLLALIGGALAVGVPLDQMVPSGWSELSAHVRTGIRELSDSDYPYTGPEDWARLVALSAIPLILGLISILAFWGGRVGAMLRMLALGVGLVGFAVPSIMNSANATLLDGAALFCVICAWIWLPRLAPGGGRLMSAAVATVAVVSIALVSALGSEAPIVDYTKWDPFHNIADVSESFGWDQTYGPIDWQRDGRPLLDIRSHGPHYWRTVVLDDFDGYAWSSSTADAPPGSELPAGASIGRASTSLNPEWVSKLQFKVDNLKSDTVIGAGTILSVKGVDGATSNGGTRVTLPPGQTLSSGDEYTVKAYIPDPTSTQLRIAPAKFPKALAPYRKVTIPEVQKLPGYAYDPNSGIPIRHEPDANAQTNLVPAVVPAWRPNAPSRPYLQHAVEESPYAGTYTLARKLTAGAKTEYAAAQSIEQYLKRTYPYSENPPDRQFPISAFLFKDKKGYCQQFSGSMALMLRLLGIPARVGSGFAPGTHLASGDYQVSDLDAHAWVEVYFSGIGWVPFDPTPAATPAQREPGALHALPATARVGPREFRGAQQTGGGLTPLKPPRAGTTSRPVSGNSFPLIPAVFGVAIAVLALSLLGLTLVRLRRFRSASPSAAAESQLSEFERALIRLRFRLAPATTLLALERRLRTVAGPDSARYAAELRAYRYASDVSRGPTLEERKAVRRELAAGGGLRAKLLALMAIPPGAPSVGRKPGERKAR